MAQAGYTPISLYNSTTASAVPTNTNLVNGELAINITDGRLFYKDNLNVVQTLATKGTAVIGGSTTQVQFNSGGNLAGSANMTFNGTTLTVADLTDSSLTAGRVTYAGTAGNLTDSANLVWDNANTRLGINQATPGSTLDVKGTIRLSGSSSGYVGLAPAAAAGSTTYTLPSSDGTAGQVLSTNGSATLSWTTAATNITISNDTSTASDLYPTFLSATTGTASTINTSNAKLLYRPSTGELKATVPLAQNGIFVNSTSASSNYTISSNTNGMSVGPITVSSGVSINITSGQRWVVI